MERKRDYMKYWRVIRYFVLQKYKLKLTDLDMLFFLYSEEYFNVDKFREFESVLGWDKKRFYRLKKEGWIDVIKPYKFGGPKALYGISFKCAKMLDSVYDKLEGGLIPVARSKNPIFASIGGYTQKIYRKAIEKLNDSIRQEQCHSHEL